MRKAVWACISLVLLTGAIATHGWAVERELWGVRLGTKAMNLLDKPGYGQPHFIGPIGAISVVTQQAPGGAATAVGSARSGPAGPSAGGGGREGARGGRGGGMRGGGRAGGRGGRGGAAGGVASVGRATGGGTVAGPGMYWYYGRPGGAVIVLTLDRPGEVIAITLTGNSPAPEAMTTRNIGLGSGYMEIIAQYGYPDEIVSVGTILELTYVDHGVRFTLDAMRVREIAI
ncbi:MAG: hypothetical protein MUQ65_10235, partial [Armatimonadetes bacterium]|nr:hypothetical protein [Armatimonadota bacterium]